MAQENNKGTPSQSILDDIQAEVSAENAPLLQFITAHAGKIAGFVLILLLALGGTAVWKWYHGNKQAEARAELARISRQLKAGEKDTALAHLAEHAPAATRLFIYMSLGQSALENGNPSLAAEAYSKAAALAGDSPLALTAVIGNAGSLLMQNKYAEALALLQETEKNLPAAQTSPHFQQLLAEAAARAGELSLAQTIYTNLAKDADSAQALYFRTRADAIASEMGKE